MDNQHFTQTDFKKITVLLFDNIALGLPSSSIESVLDISLKKESHDSFPLLTYHNQVFPVFKFDHHLNKLHVTLPCTGKVIGIKDKSENIILSIICHSVNEWVLSEDNTLTSVPDIMSNDISPVVGFTQKNSMLVMLATPSSMLSYTTYLKNKGGVNV